MTIAELIDDLKSYDPNTKVMILDGFNGGGYPREINLGPFERTIKKSDAKESGDCEDLVGETVLIMGYGCY